MTYNIIVNDKNEYLIESLTSENTLNYDELADKSNWVEISNELATWLKTQDLSGWVTANGFEPELPTIPYATLTHDPERVKEYEQRWSELHQEYPNYFPEKSDVNQHLQPWTLVNKEFYPGIILEDDSNDLDITGLHLEPLNAKRIIPKLTRYEQLKIHEYREILKCPLFICGVSDNATQVKRYLDQAIKEYLTGNSNSDLYYDGNELYYDGKRLCTAMTTAPDIEYVILLTPMFNTHDMEIGGWRWHKWGEYIGRHEVSHEYLSFETGIDYVLVWELIPLKRT